MLYVLQDGEIPTPDDMSEKKERLESIATDKVEGMLLAGVSVQELASIGYLIFQWALLNINLCPEDEELFFEKAKLEYFKYKEMKEKNEKSMD